MLIMFEVLPKNRLSGKLTYEICESKLSEGWPPQKLLYPRKEAVTGELDIERSSSSDMSLQ
jgi:hypothetical protein